MPKPADKLAILNAIAAKFAAPAPSPSPPPTPAASPAAEGEDTLAMPKAMVKGANSNKMKAFMKGFNK